jgi:GTP-binding protein
VIINHAEIAATAVTPAQYPTTLWPEFAFAGRSNVGKSSLINTMLGRKKLARTSRQPGKTRTINFYNVENKLYFVDLPGYGYAKVSKTEQEKWGGMVEGYLKNRVPLKRIFLLVDIRHEPGANDRMIYDWCVYYNLPFTVVATKSDKLSRNQTVKHAGMIRRSFNIPETNPLEKPLTNNILPFSSETRQGRDELWTMIIDSCNPGML